MIFLGVLFAFALSLTEIAVKHKEKKIADMCNYYLLALLVINMGLAALVYYCLPSISKIFLSNDLKCYFSGKTIGRALVSGFGYAVVIKASLFDIPFRDEKISIGPALLYEPFRIIIFRNLERSTHNKIEKKVAPLVREYKGNINLFISAFKCAINQEEGNKRLELTGKLQRIMDSDENVGHKCLDILVELYYIKGDIQAIRTILDVEHQTGQNGKKVNKNN